jgi:hypothetical protein
MRALETGCCQTLVHVGKIPIKIRFREVIGESDFLVTCALSGSRVGTSKQYVKVLDGNTTTIMTMTMARASM